MIFMFDMNVIKHVMNIIKTYSSHATLMIVTRQFTLLWQEFGVLLTGLIR